MLIEVTAEDIARGKSFSQTACPVALAICRVTGQTFRVTQLRIENPDGGRVVTSEDVERFVLRFDRRKPVAPFSFELPDEFLTA